MTAKALHINYKVLVIQVALHLAAFWGLLYFTPSNLGWALLIWFFTGCLGSSLGFHRLISHRAFNGPSWFKGFLALLGTLTFQGGPITWGAFHRAHHMKTDQRGDPHSAVKGFAWAHFLWIFNDNPNGFRLVDNVKRIADLRKDKWLLFLERWNLEMNLALFVIAFATLPLGTALWIMPVRIVMGWHLTYFVNSLAHGLLPFLKSENPEPRNSQALALITWGEGFHKNHHDYPYSSSFVEHWWQIDIGHIVLTLLEPLGLVRDRKYFGTRAATDP